MPVLMTQGLANAISLRYHFWLDDAVGITIALLTGLVLFRRGFGSILRAAVRG